MKKKRKRKKEKESFRYTCPVLQSTLQLVGCKARHAFKVISHFQFLLFVFFIFWIEMISEEQVMFL